MCGKVLDSSKRTGEIQESVMVCGGMSMGLDEPGRISYVIHYSGIRKSRERPRYPEHSKVLVRNTTLGFRSITDEMYRRSSDRKRSRLERLS